MRVIPRSNDLLMERRRLVWMPMRKDVRERKLLVRLQLRDQFD
jgi:hypothetical protein